VREIAPSPLPLSHSFQSWERGVSCLNPIEKGGKEMKPAISDSGFGYITIEGSKIEHDIVIRLSGEIKKRKKKLFTAHRIPFHWKRRSISIRTVQND
jgi:hypothetical protein